MPSLNLSLDFFDHPKTQRLIGALGAGAESLPIRLWCYTAKFHFRDGVLDGYSKESLENICRWNGEKGALIRELISIGFLEQIEGGFKVHDWKDHAGHFLIYHKKAVLMNKTRWKNKHPTSILQGANKDSQGRAGKARNILFDAIVENFFQGAALSKSDGSRIGKMAATLKERGALPEQVAIKKAAYLKLHPDWDISPEAVVKHWHSLEIKPKAHIPSF